MNALPPSTPMDAVKNAAICWRALVRRAHEGAADDDLDEQMSMAEIALEAALIRAGLMGTEWAIERISLRDKDVYVVFDGDRRALKIELS